MEITNLIIIWRKGRKKTRILDCRIVGRELKEPYWTLRGNGEETREHFNK